MSRHEKRVHYPATEADRDWQFFAQVVARRAKKEETKWRSFSEAKKVGLEQVKIRVREELWRAYDKNFQGQSRINTEDEWFGGITYYGISYDNNTKGNAIAELARRQIIPSKNVIEKYKKHGIAKIEVLLNPQHVIAIDGPIIIDTLLLNPKPKYAWMSLKQEGLTVFVSSEEQTPPKDYGEINPDEDLEGFVLMFNYNVNPKDKIPYRPSLFFLYSPKKR